MEEDAQQSENLVFSDSCGKEGWEPSLPSWSYFSEPGVQSQSGMIFMRTFKNKANGPTSKDASGS